LAVGDWPEVVAYAQTLQADAAAGGFTITLNTMTANDYWSQWTEWNLGITPWSARPLGTTVLNIAYAQDDQGDPVPWNESHWGDTEFTSLLEQANGTLDIGERRALFCQLEQIQMDRGSIGIAFWRNVWLFRRQAVSDLAGHPAGCLLLDGNPTPYDDHRMFLPLVRSDLAPAE
jgi:peptide/nickel transport system substrate-binding protein